MDVATKAGAVQAREGRGWWFDPVMARVDRKHTAGGPQNEGDHLVLGQRKTHELRQETAATASCSI